MVPPRAKGGRAVSLPLLRIENVSKRFGGFTALDSVSVEIAPGERFGLIGPNGSGKTTLINCITGAFQPSSGRIIFAGQDVSQLPAHKRTRRGIARSFQIPRPFKSMTVIENLMVAFDFAGRGRSKAQSDTPNLFPPNLHKDVRDEMSVILDRMGLLAKAHVNAGQLSQVELRKMELARAMAARPTLLISDEAMAGLSSSEVDEVLDLLLMLCADGITIIMIEHIMHAVMRFSTRVMCLDAGKIAALGAPKDVMANARVQEAYLGS